MRRTSRREERDSGEHGKADNSGDSTHARRAAGILSMVHHRDDSRVLGHAPRLVDFRNRPKRRPKKNLSFGKQS